VGAFEPHPIAEIHESRQLDGINVRLPNTFVAFVGEVVGLEARLIALGRQ
jgi:hypothetical protein